MIFVNIIEGVVGIVIGSCFILYQKKFSDGVLTSGKYTKSQKKVTQIFFYVLGIMFLVGGIYLIIKTFFGQYKL